MKNIVSKLALMAAIAFGCQIAPAYAQKVSSTKVTISVFDSKRDSLGVKVNKTTNDTVRTGRFVGGVTFTRLDIGLAKLQDNGSFSLSPENEFLEYRPWKTSHVSFDVLEFGYRFTNHFKAYLAAGFDWTHMRLERDITIQKNTPELTYVNEPIKFSKNRFSSSYLHIPLNFEFRSNEDEKGKRFRFVIGPEVAFLLNGKVKQISDENGKVKVKDDYHFTPFRYGATARIGYGFWGAFFKYNATDMFDTEKQKGLKNIAFGITLGLH